MTESVRIKVPKENESFMLSLSLFLVQNARVCRRSAAFLLAFFFFFGPLAGKKI